MSYRKSNRRLQIPLIIAGVGVLLIFILILISLTYTPVEVGTVALIKRFGGLTGAVYEPGLHWRVPFVDQIVRVPTVLISYETSANPDISRADYTDYAVNAQTVDGQQILVKYTILFRIPPESAVDIVKNIGQPSQVVENIVKAHSRNLTRLLAQSYTAEDLYSGEGIFQYEMEVQEVLMSKFERYGIVLDDLLIRKIEFDEDYTRAIEQQQIAQETIKTAQYQAEAAEYEKQSQIRLSEAQAQGIKLQAEAEAERQRLLADAEAYGIQARGEALEEYPELVQWEFVRNLQNIQWGILPGDGLTPLIPLPSLQESQSSTASPTTLLPPTPTPVSPSTEEGE
jgi:regulator of protease activity HflC (stomatin/prohibitin superfamily)